MSYEIDQKLGALIYEYCVSIDKPDYYPEWDTVKDSFRQIYFQKRDEKYAQEKQKRQEYIDSMRDQGLVELLEAYEIYKYAKFGLEKGFFQTESRKHGNSTITFYKVEQLKSREIQKRVEEIYNKSALFTATSAAKKMKVSHSTFLKWAKLAGIKPLETYMGRYGEGGLYSLNQIKEITEYRNQYKK